MSLLYPGSYSSPDIPGLRLHSILSLFLSLFLVGSIDLAGRIFPNVYCIAVRASHGVTGIHLYFRITTRVG